MGRFYKTQSASPMDYMFRLDTPLIEHVIGANDQYITDNLSQLAQIDNTATSFPYAQADEDRADQIAQGYSKKINDLSDVIRQDPANWRSQVSGIRDVAKDLKDNYTGGEISKIVGNQSRIKGVFDYIDKQVDEYNKTGKGISADRAMAYKQKFLSDFKGTNYNAQSGTYDQSTAFNPMSNIDIRQKLSEELAKMKASGEITYGTDITKGGQYFNKQTNKWEGITPEKILRIVTDRMNDPQLMDYMAQDSKAGIIRGAFNQDGSFISPYDYVKQGPNTIESNTLKSLQKQYQQAKSPALKEQIKQHLDAFQQQLDSKTALQWNSNSFLAPIVRGIVDEYSYGKTEQGNDLKANPVWQTSFTQSQENSRQTRGFTQQDKMQENQFRHQDEVEKQKFENQKAMRVWDQQYPLTVGRTGLKTNVPTPGGAKATATSGNPTTVPVTKDTTNKVLGSVETQPFAWQTTQPGGMTDQLKNDISLTNYTIQQTQKTLDSTLAENPNGNLITVTLQNQLANQKARLQTLQSQRDAALDRAVNQWKGGSPNTSNMAYSDYNERLVRGYMDGTLEQKANEAKSSFAEVEDKRKSIDPNSPEYGAFMRSTYYPALKRKNDATGELTSGYSIYSSEIKPKTEGVLGAAAKSTTNRTEIVGTTVDQDNNIKKYIAADPSRYKVMEVSTGGVAHGVDLTKLNMNDFTVNGVAPSTGMGDSDETMLKVTIGKKQYVIVPKDDGGQLESYLATEFNKSKDPGVQKIGKLIGSPTARTVNDMMNQMRMNVTSPAGTPDPSWVYRTIPNPADPSNIITIRSRAISTGGGNSEPKWEFQVQSNGATGKTANDLSVDDQGRIKSFVPLTSTKSSDGIYHNLDDVLSILPSNQ